MPTPIITLPIHTIEQARALAGLLRAYIDGQQPDTNDGQDWKPDPDLAGMAALACHLDAGIKAYSVAPGPHPGAIVPHRKTAEEDNFDRWQEALHRQYQSQEMSDE